MARIEGFCPQGHRVAGKNVLNRSRGKHGGTYKACRRCYNVRRAARARKKYKEDPVFKAKTVQRNNKNYKLRKQMERQNEQDRSVPN